MSRLSRSKSTFVLVHGGLRGGWAWKPVAQELRKSGHEVYHPSLDGCGERKGAMRPGITLDTHGEEIANLLFYEDLRDVVLVGTSFGGMVIARAAELARERIARLVFISAVCPLAGETLSEIFPGRPESERTQLVKGVDAANPHKPVAAFLDLESGKQAWARARATPHPNAAAEGPVDLREFWSRKWRAHVLRGKRVDQPTEAHQRRTAERLGATYDEIDTGHNLALSHPVEVARYLESLIDRD